MGWLKLDIFSNNHKAHEHLFDLLLLSINCVFTVMGIGTAVAAVIREVYSLSVHAVMGESVVEPVFCAVNYFWRGILASMEEKLYKVPRFL